VGAAAALSDASREFLAANLGLDSAPPLGPPPSTVHGCGVDLVRGLALFEFPSRAEAESLGLTVPDRRKREASAPELGELCED